MEAGVERTMWIELLGEVRAYTGDREIALGPPRQRAVLTILALRANETVSREELIGGIWGEATPLSVKGSVHTYMHGLRRALSAASDIAVARTSAGYQLVLGDQELDLSVVEARIDAARKLARSGNKTAAADLIGRALALWRSEPLGGIPGPLAAAERGRLRELRYHLIEERAELMLATGRHRELVTELAETLAVEPFREGIRAQLMLALYRSGRRAEALAEFATVRALFADELGLDPGAALTDLHLRMLRSAPDLGQSTTVPKRTHSAVPSRLPQETPGFVGRVAEWKRMTEWCFTARTKGAALVISASDGAGGIGKTSLAVRFARAVSSHYPDGQLYIDLRGFDPNRSPLRTTEALGRLLWALGGATKAVDPDVLASMYRTVLSTKRVLIVLDNVATTDQVRDLLPGTSNSLVLITSRNRLSGLVARDGARRLTLGVLTEAEAIHLLRNTIGTERVDNERPEALKLIRLCGHLPLALRVAAGRISAEPGSTLRDPVGTLLSEQNPLDMVDVDDEEITAVHSVISWSYKSLEPALAKTFRLLGLLRGPDVGIAAAAALLDVPVADAKVNLDTLRERHLLEGGTNRFRFHDLIKIYAGKVANRAEAAGSRSAAILRTMVWYVHGQRSALLCLSPAYPLPPLSVPETRHALPEFDTRESVFSWFETEAPNILAMADQAAELDEHEIAWQLAWGMFEHYNSTGATTEWMELLTVGHTSSGKLDKRGPRARLSMMLGIASSRIGQHENAVRFLKAALDHVRYIDDGHLHASILTNLASTLRTMRKYEKGLEYAHKSLELATRAGGDYQKAGSYDALCELYVEAGQPGRALKSGRVGLEYARASCANLIEVNVLINIAHALRDLGDEEAARGEYKAVLEFCVQLGDRYHEALALRGMAELHHRTGRFQAAREQARRALEIFERFDYEEAETTRELLSLLDSDVAIG
ncbi:AfsR/SARP family transcriptional regulator [Amycolatopsis thailandensis]|uniref:AfsR/SARP family transcriptional regulator n=1 Tax=Amycolatopsis thailandensis TaxID=589330 RepID=UPI00363D774F